MMLVFFFKKNHLTSWAEAVFITVFRCPQLLYYGQSRPDDMVLTTLLLHYAAASWTCIVYHPASLVPMLMSMYDKVDVQRS